MAQKSSFLLAVLFVVNPVMLLLFQNCSLIPQAKNFVPTQAERPVQAPQKTAVTYNYEKAL